MSVDGQPVAILGGGSFGTAMAKIVADNGYQTRLWVRDPETAAVINASRENARYLPGAELPPSVVATESLEEALHGVGMVFVAVPSKAFAEVLGQSAAHVPEGALAISCTKGISSDGFQFMSQMLQSLWPQTRVGVLSGPNLAKEIVEQRFTGTVIASADAGLCEAVQGALSCSYFRVYDNPDMFGVELAGALKNIYAIATGMAAALDVGQNSQAFLITRSLAEMSRFAVRMGANPLTFLGLAGVGDLIVTCSSPLSRNYRVGHMIGSGKTMEQALAELGQTAEGLNTIRLVATRAREEGVYMPIACGLYDILFEGRSLHEVIQSLMTGEHNQDVDLADFQGAV